MKDNVPYTKYPQTNGDLDGKLTGRAAEAFRAIPDEEIHLYPAVKEALLARYSVTPEAYRRRFRESKKHSEDSYTSGPAVFTEQPPSGLPVVKPYQERMCYSCFYWNIFSIPCSQRYRYGFGIGERSPYLKQLVWLMSILTPAKRSNPP